MIELLFSFFVFVFPGCVYCMCGWTGSVVVRVITLGKVNLAWGADLDSIGTAVIGLIFLLLLGSTIYWLLQ